MELVARKEKLLVKSGKNKQPKQMQKIFLPKKKDYILYVIRIYYKMLCINFYSSSFSTFFFFL